MSACSVGVRCRRAVSACGVGVRWRRAVAACGGGVRCRRAVAACGGGVRWRRAVSACSVGVRCRRAVAACGGGLRWRRAVAACSVGVRWRRAVAASACGAGDVGVAATSQRQLCQSQHNSVDTFFILLCIYLQANAGIVAINHHRSCVGAARSDAAVGTAPTVAHRGSSSRRTVVGSAVLRVHCSRRPGTRVMSTQCSGVPSTPSHKSPTIES